MAIERQWTTFKADGTVAVAVDYDLAYEPNINNPTRVYVRHVYVTNRTGFSVGLRFIVRQGDRFWDRLVQPQAAGAPALDVPIIDDLPGGKGYLLFFDSSAESWMGLDCIPLPGS